MTIPSAAALFGTMVLLSLAPGPTEVALVARSTTYGPASGAMMIAGIVFADFLLIAVAFSGLATAAAALGGLPSAAIGCAGVFLLYLGIAQLWTSASTLEVSSAKQQLASFSTGLLLTLGDPKAVLGYAALLPAFVDISSASIGDAFAVFLLAAAAISLAKGLYVALADRAASLLLSSQPRRTLNRVAGGALVCAGIILVAQAFAPVVAAGISSAAALSPGPASQPPGARLGQPVIFENEITDSHCYPLITRKGLVLLWLSAMHEFGSRVLVRRCVEYDPRISVPPGRRHGDSRVEWEELRFTDSESFPIARDLELPGYQYFSNPSFCQSEVAYWTQENHRWSITIYDLAKSQTVATQFIRHDEVEADNPGHFELPKWDDSCTKASVTDDPPIEVK